MKRISTESYSELAYVMGLDVCLNCAKLEAITAIVKPKDKDFKGTGSYQQRLMKKFKKKLQCVINRPMHEYTSYFNSFKSF